MDKGDKIALITGATSGIGKAIALELSQRQLNVFIVARDEDRARTTIKEIEEKTGNRPAYFIGDLECQRTIPVLAQIIKEKLQRLDILILNAGAVFTNRATTVEGIERSMALNHFAPIHLTSELMPLLKESRPCRVINVSAGAHLLSPVDLEDFNFERNFGGVKAYARSKMAAIMGFYEFASQYPENDIQFLSLHPGVIGTSFSENNGKLYSFFMSIFRPIMRSPASGAAPVVHLALSPELAGKSGLYFNRFKEKKSHALTYDKAFRQKVWDLTWQKIKEITE